MDSKRSRHPSARRGGSGAEVVSRPPAVHAFASPVAPCHNAWRCGLRHIRPVGRSAKWAIGMRDAFDITAIIVGAIIG
ncbi:MAG: hypothetical protein M3P51_04160, partial [Chloroflexota bacterium]|nr:hypothetical protein [Chloroflexota bacterium]